MHCLPQPSKEQKISVNELPTRSEQLFTLDCSKVVKFGRMSVHNPHCKGKERVERKEKFWLLLVGIVQEQYVNKQQYLLGTS